MVVTPWLKEENTSTKTVVSHHNYPLQVNKYITQFLATTKNMECMFGSVVKKNYFE
jgi:hypothetical protein